MKKNLFNKVLILSLSVLLFSCASTKVENNTDTSAASEITAEPEITEPVIPQEVLDFYNDIDGIKLTVTDSPKYVTIGNDFKTSYKVLVTDKEGNPKADFPIAIQVPFEKWDNQVVAKIVTQNTDEKGIIDFTAEKPAFACNSKVKFYPSPVNEDPDVIFAAMSKSVSADYKVRSDIVRKGALLFVWDFNEKDKAINNSYELLAEIRSYGIQMAGNAPINEPSEIGKPLSTLYSENYEIVENMYGYLVVGTVKFAKPVEAVEDGSGYSCSLIAEIQTIRMEDGKEVFSGTYTNETVGSNWNNAVSTCKKQLSSKIAEDLIYGL